MSITLRTGDRGTAQTRSISGAIGAGGVVTYTGADTGFTGTPGAVGRVFEISGSTTEVRIDALTVANGMAIGTVVSPTGPVTLGGGILNMGAELTLSTVVVLGNQAGASDVADTAGGGVANVFGATSSELFCY